MPSLAWTFAEPPVEQAYLAWASSAQKLAPSDSLVGQFVHRYGLELVTLDDPTETFLRLKDAIGELGGLDVDLAVLYRLASDALVLAGRIEEARAFEPPPSPGSAARAWADRDLTLAYWTGASVGGVQAVALAGPKVTRFGKDNFDLVAEHLDVQIEALQARRHETLLSEWASACRTHKFQLFSGGAWLRDRETLYLSAHPAAVSWSEEQLRKAENVVRNEMGLPNVGEGWVQETALYYALVDAFQGETVEHHASPGWLGRQHLDIFFPQRQVAVEFQGRQHDEPVAFFGGEEAYLQTVKRDKVKRSKCRQASVIVIDVRPGYDLAEVIQAIRMPRHP